MNGSTGRQLNIWHHRAGEKSPSDNVLPDHDQIPRNTELFSGF